MYFSGSGIVSPIFAPFLFFFLNINKNTGQNTSDFSLAACSFNLWQWQIKEIKLVLLILVFYKLCVDRTYKD
jgi:hypothetical protein